MAMGAILKAARDAIRTATSKDFKFVGVRPEGRPPATTSPWYIGLDENRVDNAAQTCLKEQFAIDVVITTRTGIAPDDRSDELYLNSLFGLDPLERIVLAALHGTQAVRLAANAFLAAAALANYYTFITPLYYTGRAKSAPRGPDWIDDETDTESTFMTRTLTFAGGIRPQALGNIQ